MKQTYTQLHFFHERSNLQEISVIKDIDISGSFASEN
jgi:hypothetical protein